MPSCSNELCSKQVVYGYVYPHSLFLRGAASLYTSTTGEL